MASLLATGMNMPNITISKTLGHSKPYDRHLLSAIMKVSSISYSQAFECKKIKESYDWGHSEHFDQYWWVMLQFDGKWIPLNIFIMWKISMFLVDNEVGEVEEKAKPFELHEIEKDEKRSDGHSEENQVIHAVALNLNFGQSLVIWSCSLNQEIVDF